MIDENEKIYTVKIKITKEKTTKITNILQKLNLIIVKALKLPARVKAIRN